MTLAVVWAAVATGGEIAENTATGVRLKVADLTVGDVDTHSFTLTGTDASDFEVVGTALYLKQDTALNYEVKASYAVTVTVDDGEGGSADKSLTLTVADVNDKATGTVAITGTVAEGKALTAVVSNDVADDDGLPQNMVYSYAWQRGVTTTAQGRQTTTWTAIVGATSSSYTLAPDDVGNTLQVVVSFADADGTAESLTSAATGTVAANNAPTLTVAWAAVATGGAIAENTPTATRLKVADLTVVDADLGDSHSFALSGTDANVFEVAGAVLYLKQDTVLNYEVKASYAVTVTVDDGRGGTVSPTLTLTVTDANDPATGTVTLTGTVEQGEALTVSVSAVADADGLPDPLVYSYAWQRSTDAGNTWTAIDNATGTTYTLVPADVGHTLRVVVSFTDTAGNNEALTSAATLAVTNVNDPVTGTVALTGLLAGELQPDVSGIEDADGLPAVSAYTYQWQRSADGNTWVNIVGATAATYPLGPVDVGSQLQVVVGFTDLQGTDETLTSTPTAAVVARPSIVVDGGGGVQQGAMLRAGTGTLGGVGETVALAAWQWQRSADAGNTWTAIQGADGATYTLVQADVGQRVRVKVSGTSTAAGGAVTAITDSLSLATAAVANVNDAATGPVTLTGDAAWGQALTALTARVEDVDGTPPGGFVYTYAWQRGTADDQGDTTWTAIGGADSATYTLAQADVGNTVRVVVSFTDALGSNETLTSAAMEVQPLPLVGVAHSIRSSAVGIAVAPAAVLQAYDAAGSAVSTYPALHVIVTDGQAGESLTVAAQVLTDNGVTRVWDATRKVLTLTGGADVAAYQAVLRAVTLEGVALNASRQVLVAVGPDAGLAPFWYTDSTGAVRVRYYEVFPETAGETPATMVTRARGLPARFGMQPYLATVASAAEQDFIVALITPALSPDTAVFGLYKNNDGDWVYDGGPEQGRTYQQVGYSKLKSSWSSEVANGVRGVIEVVSASNDYWYPALE